LITELDTAINIAQSTHWVRRAAWHEVRFAATTAHFVSNLFHRCIEIGTSWVFTQVGTENSVQKHIARTDVGFTGLFNSVLKHHFAGHTELAGRRRGLSDVVRLNCTHRDDGIGTLLQRFTHRKLEFSGFVTASRESGTVVSLDV
jgi:hypothetical protein